MLRFLTNDMDQLAHAFWHPLLRHASPSDAGRSEVTAPYELDETEEHYVMSFDVPGIHRDDLAIEVTGNQLVVAGERRAEGGGTSRRQGKFQHAFTLPDGITAEAIVAEHKDGVLRLAIQKPASVRPTRVKIADGTTQQRDGGFFKSLVSSKKAKDAVVVKGATAKNEAVAMAN